MLRTPSGGLAESKKWSHFLPSKRENPERPKTPLFLSREGPTKAISRHLTIFLAFAKKSRPRPSKCALSRGPSPSWMTFSESETFGIKHCNPKGLNWSFPLKILPEKNTLFSVEKYLMNSIYFKRSPHVKLTQVKLRRKWKIRKNGKIAAIYERGRREEELGICVACGAGHPDWNCFMVCSWKHDSWKNFKAFQYHGVVETGMESGPFA